MREHIAAKLFGERLAMITRLSNFSVASWLRSLLLLQRLRQVAMPASWEEPWLSIRMAKFCAVDTPTLISLSQETKLLWPHVHS